LYISVTKSGGALPNVMHLARPVSDHSPIVLEVWWSIER